MIPGWAAQYVGIPFVELGRSRAGLDCWGLVRLVLEREFGIQGLPDYTERYTSTRDRAIAAVYAEDLPRHWQQVTSPVAGDIAVFRVGGQPMHVGLVLARGWMLSVERGVDSAIERIEGSHWKGRLEGYYRYAGHHAR
jgi:cell wall-associated NlpC family hydrolase